MLSPYIELGTFLLKDLNSRNEGQQFDSVKIDKNAILSKYTLWFKSYYHDWSD